MGPAAGLEQRWADGTEAACAGRGSRMQPSLLIFFALGRRKVPRESDAGRARGEETVAAGWTREPDMVTGGLK
jgi:hypothetical protein